MKQNEIERLTMVETKIDMLHDDIKEIKNSLKEHVVWEEGKYTQMDGKYAGKWTEKGFWILIGSIVSTILGLIIFIF